MTSVILEHDSLYYLSITCQTNALYCFTGHPTFKRPKQENVLRFQAKLLENDIIAFIRITRGDDESAACGQLATKKKISSVE